MTHEGRVLGTPGLGVSHTHAPHPDVYVYIYTNRLATVSPGHTSNHSPTLNLSDDGFGALSQSPPFNLLPDEKSLSDACLFTPPMHGSEISPITNPQPSASKRSSPPVDAATTLKRQRNNVAAKKYRQKKVDRITELEGELADMKDERDDLRLRLARQEAETAALRSMLKMTGAGSPGSADGKKSQSDQDS